jgi:hypothetical protein
MNRIAKLALVGLALSSRLALAWGQHYLVTDRAIKDLPELSETVSVEPIEVFLSDRTREVAQLFDEYYSWLRARGSKRFHPMTFDVAHPDRTAFLRAARLNPATHLFLLRRLLPGETGTGSREVPFAQISPYEEGKTPFVFRFEDASGQRMTARSVLTTFVDEPDWEMDINLWSHPEFGYGKIPYGSETGGTSKAPFHILYRHENILVRTFAPEMLEGMTYDRIELFTRLAALAFKSGHRYWGLRFTAWALHYIEDLAQPYHSKAVPSAGLWYYVTFVVSPDKARIKRETTQLVKNRHYAYEDFVAYGLQQSYTEKRELFSRLAESLSQGDAVYEDVQNAGALIERVTTFAATHAPAIDEAVVRAYGPRMTEDPSYDIETDASYQVRKVIDGLPPEVAERILAETARDFGNAGRAARTLLKMVVPSLWVPAASK